MSLFLKITAGVLLATIISVILSKQGKEFSLLLTVCITSCIGIAAVSVFEPIIAFLTRLTEIGRLQDGFLSILLKIVGIGLLSQITITVCADAGNQAFSKILQIVATVVILWLCLPLLEQMLSLFESLLGEL